MRPVLAAFTALFSLSALADPVELLIPVTGEELEEVEHLNSYQIRKEEYFAAEMRIVRVNIDALFSQGPITVDLFKDQSINVNFESIESRNSWITFSWDGEIETTATRLDLTAQGMTEKQAGISFSTLFDFRVSAARETDYGFTGQDPSEVDCSEITISRNGEPRHPYFSILAQFLVVNELGTASYYLGALRLTPEYHLLVRRDEQKAMAARMAPDEYRHFKESLGPDPRAELIKRCASSN